MTPWRIRSLLSLSIVLSTAVARWRAPACRYPSSTSFVMTAKDATRRSKRITTPPMRHPPTSPEGYFSRLCHKSLSRSGPFGTGLTRTRSRLAQEEVFHDELPFAGDERTPVRLLPQVMARNAGEGRGLWDAVFGELLHPLPGHARTLTAAGISLCSCHQTRCNGPERTGNRR